jgi:hypothetical protein
MATTPVPHEIGGISSSEEERRSYAQHVKPYGNNFMVLKVAPPLMVSEAQLDHCVESIRSVVETVHSSKVFWIDALNLGRRAMSL